MKGVVKKTLYLLRSPRHSFAYMDRDIVRIKLIDVAELKKLFSDYDEKTKRKDKSKGKKGSSYL